MAFAPRKKCKNMIAQKQNNCNCNYAGKSVGEACYNKKSVPCQIIGFMIKYNFMDNTQNLKVIKGGKNQKYCHYRACRSRQDNVGGQVAASKRRFSH